MSMITKIVRLFRLAANLREEGADEAEKSNSILIQIIFDEDNEERRALFRGLAEHVEAAGRRLTRKGEDKKELLTELLALVWANASHLHKWEESKIEAQLRHAFWDVPGAVPVEANPSDIEEMSEEGRAFRLWLEEARERCKRKGSDHRVEIPEVEEGGEGQVRRRFVGEARVGTLVSAAIDHKGEKTTSMALDQLLRGGELEATSVASALRLGLEEDEYEELVNLLDIDRRAEDLSAAE